MSTWVYGVDISYHDLTTEQATLLKSAGVQVLIQCLWTAAEQPAHRVTNLRTAMQAGLTIAGYASINKTPGSGVEHMDKARDGVPDDIWASLKKVAVDVELQGIQVADVRAAVDRVQELGKPKDIYTSYNAWVNYVGNPQTFTDCGLWNANWDEQPDFDFPRLRYGGWNDDQVWGEQWSGGTNVHGVHADRNQFRAEAFEVGAGAGIAVPATDTPTPPPAPTAQQLLGAELVWGQIVEEFAKGNTTLSGTPLKEQAKFLLGL